MQQGDSRRIGPLKLHTKTTILISAVLVVVFFVIASFYDRFTTRISETREYNQVALAASQVSRTVEHDIKRERRKGNARSQGEESFEPDWTEVQEDIKDTVMANASVRPSEVRVYRTGEGGRLEEAVRLPENAGPDLLNLEPPRVSSIDTAPHLVLVGEQGPTRLIAAVSRVYSPVEKGPSRPTGHVTVLMAFDENASVAARLRRLIWPLMAAAIIAITLVTYLLFRHIIYNPIDKLLLAMSRAEAGDLGAEVQPASSDEIGLLTSRFNRMLGRIRQMTDQLGIHQRKLEERVTEATAEIAERKEQLEEANLQLFEMQRQLTELERLAVAGQLAAQFAHEVGTPLNLISGHVQLLRARTTDDRVLKRLDIIAGQIERITHIVRSMLDSTRKPKPQFEPVDINAALARIMDATQPTLAAKGVELSMKMGEDVPLVSADPDQLQQVFINLINNSLDAMPAGGSLTVTTSRSGGEVRIDLADSGEGIEPEHIERVFDPMFTTRRGRGTGLGLTIVRQIVSDHGGAIEVESRPGSGTVFHIRIPSLAPAGRVAADEENPIPVETGARTDL